MFKQEGWSFLTPTQHQLGLDVGLAQLNAHTMVFGTSGRGKSAFTQSTLNIASTYRTPSQQAAIAGGMSSASMHSKVTLGLVSRKPEENPSWLEKVYEELHNFSWQGVSLNQFFTSWLGHLFTAWLLGVLITLLPIPWNSGKWSQDVLSFLTNAAHSLSWITPDHMQGLTWAWPHVLWPLTVGICTLALSNEVKLLFKAPIHAVLFIASFWGSACARVVLTCVWYKKRIQEWLAENEHAVLMERVNKKTKLEKKEMPSAL